MLSAFFAVAVALAAGENGEQPKYTYVPIPDKTAAVNTITTRQHLIEYTVDMQLLGEGTYCICGYDDYTILDDNMGRDETIAKNSYFDMCNMQFFNRTGDNYPTQEQMDRIWALRSTSSNNQSRFCTQPKVNNRNEPLLTVEQAIARCAAEPQCQGFQRYDFGMNTLENLRNEPMGTTFFWVQPTGTLYTYCNASQNLRTQVATPSHCYRKQQVTATAMQRIDAASGIGFRDVYIEPNKDAESRKIERTFTVIFAFVGIIASQYLVFLLAKLAYDRYVVSGYMGVAGGSLM